MSDGQQRQKKRDGEKQRQQKGQKRSWGKKKVKPLAGTKKKTARRIHVHVLTRILGEKEIDRQETEMERAREKDRYIHAST